MGEPHKRALGRDRHLDGLRGVAALAVVIEHFAALLPISRAPLFAGQLGELASNALRFPVEAGNFAVYIFFAISGVVVANAALNKPWPISLASRYARLTIPMIAAGILAGLALSAFPGKLPTIAQFLPNHWTTTIYQDGPPTVRQAITEAAWGAYLNSDPKINPVLWSMRVELWGSLGIFTGYRFVAPYARIGTALGIAMLLLFTGFWQYLAFPIGAVIFELNGRGVFHWPRRVGAIIAVLGVGLGIAATMSALRYYGRVVSGYLPFDADFRAILSSVGGLLVVSGVLASETSKSLLTTRAPLFLGRVSYALYLTHMPLLYGPLAAVYLTFGSPPDTAALAIWSLAFFASALLLGWLLTVWIDEPNTRMVRVPSNTA